MKPFFHSGLCTCVHAVTILKSFFRILKLRTSPSHRTGTCNLSRFLSTAVLLQFIHHIHSPFLSFFYHLVLARHVNVSDDPCSLSAITWRSVMWPLYAITGLWLISLNSFDRVDDQRLFQSLQSFPLHIFLNTKMKFFHEGESLSPSLIRTCCR